ncbi:MAG: hypothetical protein V4596_12340 [Bdellovibrionota bacterium]
MGARHFIILTVSLSVALCTGCVKARNTNSGNAPTSGSITGGGGFAATNSAKILIDVVHELVGEIEIASDRSFSSLPLKWDKLKLISVISNIELKYDLTKYREGKELLFDYDQKTNKIFALRSYFLAYASESYESVSYSTKKDLKIKILHEVAHLMYMGESEAKNFAMSIYSSMQNEFIACWDQSDVLNINLNSYNYGFLFPVIGGYGIICGPFNQCDIDHLAMDDSYYSKYAALFGFDNSIAPLMKVITKNEYGFSDKKIQLPDNTNKIYNSVARLIKKNGSEKNILCTYFNRKDKKKFFKEEKRVFLSEIKSLPVATFLNLTEKCEAALSKKFTPEMMSSENKTGNITCQKDPTDKSIFECTYRPTFSLYAKSKNMMLDSQIPDIIFESDSFFINELSNIKLLQRKPLYSDLKLISYVSEETLQADTQAYADCILNEFKMKN